MPKTKLKSKTTSNRPAQRRLRVQRLVSPRGQFYKGIEWFACWLLDNVEGHTVTEEELRPWAIKAWKEHLKRANTVIDLSSAKDKNTND